MRLLTSCIWSMACATFFTLAMQGAAVHGEVPEYYRILADDYSLPETNLIRTGVLPGKTEETLWHPSPQDVDCGFAAALVNGEEMPSPHWIWRETSPVREFHFISLLDEFRAQLMAVRTLRPLKSMAVECSALDDGNGHKILPENWDVRVIKNICYNTESGWRQNSNLLMKAAACDWPADFTAYYWLTIHAPADAVPGVYEGTVTISTSEGKRQFLPVKFRVLDKTYKAPEVECGMWMPGHGFRANNGYCRNYAPAWYTADRLVDLFRFWKTRGLTSPTYSGWYPEISLVDGEIQMDFAEMDEFALAPKRAGIEGHVIVGDTLLFEYWAHTAAMRIKDWHGGKIPLAGDLGIKSCDGKTFQQTGVPYGPLDAEFFAKIIRKVLEHAQEAGWPKVLFYPEEEIGNTSFKEAGYDFFMPVLLKTAGKEHCVTVDNNIGHMNDRIDRGKRDGTIYRAYNAWDQQAIDDAHREGAHIWTFNRGFQRSAWGHYLQRIGAEGFHQWADNWDGHEYGAWFNTITAGEGKVMTSVNYERAAMGLRDLSLLRELEGLGAEYAEELKQINDIIKLEMLYKQAERYYREIKDGELEARRWQTLLALSRAGRLTAVPSSSEKATDAEVRVKVASVELLESEAEAVEEEIGLVLESREAADACLDGLANESAYARAEATASEFHHTREREMVYRSQAASDEDFARYAPVPCRVSVTHDAKGLYFHFRTEGPSFASLFRNRKSDDVSLWEDDCYDIFLQPSANSGVWQLIFNTADQTLLLKEESQVIRGSGIKVVTLPDGDGGSGGYQQEVFIPYSALELEGMPPVGSIWKMNIGRELCQKEQYTTWSQVMRNFGIGEGHLRFMDSSPEISCLSMGNGKYGRNLMEGTVSRAGAVIELRNPSGRLFSTQSDESGKFSLVYPVTAKDVGNWLLKITGPDGTVWREQGWTVERQDWAVDILALSPVAISGDRFYFDAAFKLGNAEEQSVLHVSLVDDKGRQFDMPPQTLKQTGKQRFYVDTCGLPPGEYRVKAWLEDSSMAAVSQMKCRILQNAW